MQLVKRHIGFVYLLCFCIIHSYGQDCDYFDYYKNIYVAENHIFEDNMQEALFYYETAFSKVDYVFVKDLVNAAICSMRLENDTLFLQYLEKAFIQGWDIKSFKNNHQIYHYNESITSLIRERLKKYQDDYELQFDHGLRSEIREIIKQDQKYRKPFLLGIIPKLSYPEFKLRRIHFVDSVNRVKMDSIIKNYGFPGEKLIGYCGESKMINTFFHHNSEQYYTDSLLINFIYCGFYSPFAFAIRYDYHHTNYTLNTDHNKGSEKAYYIYNPETIAPNDSMVKIVNQWRKEICLPDISTQIESIEYRNINEFQYKLRYF